MKSVQSKFSLGIFIMLLTVGHSIAVDIVDLAKAQQVLNKISKIVEKYQRLTVTPESPKPLQDTSGKFILPYDEDGMTTEWAKKALTAKVGAAIGAKVGEKASGMLTSKVPFGGLLAGKTKNKAATMGAITAIGGWDFIRDTSSLSFNNLKDYAVYMHLNHKDDADFVEALAAAMAVYPKLEKTFKSSIDQAYKKAKKSQR